MVSTYNFIEHPVSVPAARCQHVCHSLHKIYKPYKFVRPVRNQQWTRILMETEIEWENRHETRCFAIAPPYAGDGDDEASCKQYNDIRRQ